MNIKATAMRYVMMLNVSRETQVFISLRKPSAMVLQYKVNVYAQLRICYNIARRAVCISVFFSHVHRKSDPCKWLELCKICRSRYVLSYSIHLLDTKTTVQLLVNATPLNKSSIQRFMQQASHPVFSLYPLLIPPSSNSLLGGQHRMVTVPVLLSAYS